MKSVLVCLLLVLTPLLAVADTSTPVHVINFSDYQNGSAESWLAQKGFVVDRDFKARKKTRLTATSDRLVIEARRRAFGIMTNESVDVPEFTFVEVDWGVNRFPAGASYEQGVRNEALLLMIFLGDEQKPSGSILIPDSPYFVALFLCDGDDRINHPYVGSYFRKGGRYVCGAKPFLGETVTTRFNLLAAYRSYFDKEGDDSPAVSGIALALDTSKADSRGRSSAFIKEVRFYR